MARSAARCSIGWWVGTVLAEADRVVGPHEGDRDLLDRGQAHRGSHVVGEHEEGAAVGAGQPLERDAVEDHAHGVLADAEVQGAPVGAALPLVRLLALGDERGLAGHRGVVGLGEVGRASPQLGQLAGQGAEDLAGCRARRDPLGVGRELRQGLLEPVGQARRRRGGRAGWRARRWALRHAAYRLFHAWWAALPRFLTSRACASTPAVDLEGLLRVEAEQLLGGGDLVGAQGRAVRLAGAAGRGGGPGDDGVQAHEGGLRRARCGSSRAPRGGCRRPRCSRRCPPGSTSGASRCRRPPTRRPRSAWRRPR